MLLRTFYVTDKMLQKFSSFIQPEGLAVPLLPGGASFQKKSLKNEKRAGWWNLLWKQNKRL